MGYVRKANLWLHDFSAFQVSERTLLNRLKEQAKPCKVNVRDLYTFLSVATDWVKRQKLKLFIHGY